MRKQKLILSIISSIVFISIGVITITQTTTEREKFEQFLLDDLRSLNIEYKSDKGAKVLMDKPEMAGIQDYYMTIDPKLKRVPHERLVSAIKETEKKYKSTKSEFSDHYEWIEVPSNMGGRMRSLMIDPNDSESRKVWAGSVTGGLWYNNDIYLAGSQWNSVSDLWENLSISSIVADPNNPQVFYVGTGEPQTAVTIYRESSTRGVGIWKTSDAGDTWELLSSTEDFPYISDIIVKDESGQSVIYAGVVSGSHQGENHTPVNTDGLYRSTDAGSTWTQVFPNITDMTVPYSPSDIELAASGRIFVGTYRNIDGNGGANILYSDDGINWTVFSDYNSLIKSSIDATVIIPGRTMLASSESSPNTIYAVIAAGGYTQENWIYYRGRYILKTEDNGVNWTEQELPYIGSGWATLAWHALTIEVDPNNANTIYAGGLNMHKSSDGGLTWDEISSWYNYGAYADPTLPPYLHADQHSITFKQGSSDTICFTNDGGVFVTLNGTESEIDFIEKSDNLNTLQFYTCDLNPDSATIDFVGGLQDNGTVAYSGNPLDKVESGVSGGDGAYCFYDSDNYLISTVYYNRIYASRETSTGYQYIQTINLSSGTFISPSAYDDPNNTFYANAVSFTGARADQLARIKNVTSSSYSVQYINLGTGSAVHFSHLKYSKYSTENNTQLYVGTQAGGLFRINNAQATPSSNDIGDNTFPTANISCVAEGATSEELVVTFSNYGVSSVWYTNDGGVSWIEKESNLPDIPVRWALFDPENSLRVLLATEVGIWGTDDISAETVLWEPLNNGIPKVRVDMLRLREWDNTILAATHGRGMFYCDLEGGTVPEVENPTNIIIGQEPIVNVFPNPSSGIIRIKCENIYDDISVSIVDNKGSIVKRFENNNISSDTEFDISDLSDGLYFVNISLGQKSITKKIILKK